MRIDLTPKEFRRLLDLVYIGNWVLNSTRGDDRFQDYDDLESKLFALCRTNGMDEVLSNIISPEDLYARTGIQKQMFNTIYQLMADKMKQPENLQ